MNIVDYRVVMSDDIASRVMELVNDGYEPLGGIAIRHGSSHGHTFVQAMVKYDLTEKVEER